MKVDYNFGLLTFIAEKDDITMVFESRNEKDQILLTK